MNFEEIKQAAFFDEIEKVALSQKTLIGAASKSWPKSFRSEDIKSAAFVDELEKISGARSEVTGQLINPFNYPLGIPAALIGLIVGKREKEDREKANKKIFSNILIPGVAPYRLGRRISTIAAAD